MRRALMEVGALKFDETNPFVYASRKIGPVYVDVRRLANHPAHWAEVVDELARAIGEEVARNGFDVVTGGELGDLLFSIPVAMRLGRPHIMIRKAAKTYGLGGRIVGHLERGQAAVHVSDLITAGTSAMDWVNVIREAGSEVRDYFVVVDRKQGGDEALWAVGVKVHALVDFGAEFVSAAVDEGWLEEGGGESIRSYLADPEGWAKRLLLSHPELLGQRVAAANGKLVSREGLDILTLGYPELQGELGDYMRRKLRSIGVKERVDSLGYGP